MSSFESIRYVVVAEERLSTLDLESIKDDVIQQAAQGFETPVLVFGDQLENPLQPKEMAAISRMLAKGEIRVDLIGRQAHVFFLRGAKENL